nr:unnamed protein product [Callosobruchus chinensis]
MSTWHSYEDKKAFADFVVPYVDFIENNFILMHDNTRRHTARITQQYINDVDIDVLEWPALRPNANPIEQSGTCLGEEYEVYRFRSCFATLEPFALCIGVVHSSKASAKSVRCSQAQAQVWPSRQCLANISPAPAGDTLVGHPDVSDAINYLQESGFAPVTDVATVRDAEKTQAKMQSQHTVAINLHTRLLKRCSHFTVDKTRSVFKFERVLSLYRPIRCLSWSIPRSLEVDQGHLPANTTTGQALFKATGFIGVSEPDDSDDVEEGDILDEVVVRPRGRPMLKQKFKECNASRNIKLFEQVVKSNEVSDANLELDVALVAVEAAVAAIRLAAPKVRWYVSRREASGEPLEAARC